MDAGAIGGRERAPRRLDTGPVTASSGCGGGCGGVGRGGREGGVAPGRGRAGGGGAAAGGGRGSPCCGRPGVPRCSSASASTRPVASCTGRPTPPPEAERLAASGVELHVRGRSKGWVSLLLVLHDLGLQGANSGRTRGSVAFLTAARDPLSFI
nr:tapetal oleosin GRP-16-like [Lolium perenne]